MTKNPASSPDLNLTRDPRQDARAQKQARKIRDIFVSTLKHGLLIFVGMFFAVPFLWMLLTSFKSDKDVFHTPPRWLPHDAVRVEINGQEYPLYNVKTSDGVKQYAALKIESGVAYFVDPAEPDVVIPTELQQGTERVAELVEEVSFRWQNYPDAMNRGSRPGVGASFWVYFKNSLIIAFFMIVGTLVSNTPVAYAFARLKFPGRDFLFILVLATMMLPFQVTMIPIYLLFND
ncbi:MAG: carbohydrate ABC transporter permease, partial [Chloroflexi bacterium]|nr:carbohydrate ABC transporter permease [Chloroflexota bacterium]